MKNLDQEIKEVKLTILKMTSGWLAISYLVGAAWLAAQVYNLIF